MKSLLIGSLIAGVAMFFWGFVFWGLIPAPGLHDPANEGSVWQSLSENMPETGVYFLPNPEGDQASIDRLRQGPIAMVFLNRRGAEPMSASLMILGFLHMLVTTFLIGLLLKTALPILVTYGRRVSFVLLAGIAAAFWNDLSMPIWWYAPLTFFVWTALYDVVAWLLAGSILARFVKPEHERVDSRTVAG